MREPPLKPEPKSKSAASLPFKAAAEELAFLRKTFRDLVSSYATKTEADITQLLAAVSSEADGAKVPASRLHDLRDMLMLLRSLDVKPAKGRRRDLKKIESLIEELRAIADGWE